jgi:hypothetical protein
MCQFENLKMSGMIDSSLIFKLTNFQIFKFDNERE